MSQTRIFHCLIVNLLICRGEASLPTAKHDSWVPDSVRVQPTAACQRQPFAKSLGQSKALRHDVAVTVTKPAQLSQNAELLGSCRKLRGKYHEDHNPQCQIYSYSICFSNISQHLRCPQNCGRGAIFLCQQWSERLQSKTKHEEVLAPPFLGDDTYWRRVLRNPFLVASAQHCATLIRDMKNLNISVLHPRSCIPSDLSSNNEVNINARGA